MRLRVLGTVSVILLVLAACVGDDPAPTAAATPAVDGGTGGACSATTPCSSGVCVDGVCCDSACTGLCEACNVPGREGTCTAVVGRPSHGTCSGDANGPCAGTCDGSDRASCNYPTVECGAGSCAGGVATVAPRCSAGACPATTPQACALGCLGDGCLGVKQVAAGYYHVCAVLTDGKVRCWGRNENGEAGQSATEDVKTPTEVGGLSNVTAVAATFSASCALLSDRTVKCWGSNGSGELGRGGAPDGNIHSTPELVPGLTDVTFIAGSSGGAFCAIAGGGAVKCWGSNGNGQLGDGSVGVAKTSPVTVCAPDGSSCTPSANATFVAGGDNHTCAIFAGGKVACWGNNSEGQLGQNPVGTNFPIAKTIPNLSATYLTAGNQLTCAAGTSGEALCWGANFSGRLGNGVDEVGVAAPTKVCTKQDCSTHLTGVTAVTTYDESSCALASGDVKCWGINSGGQLGDGNASNAQNYAATTAIAKTAVALASGGGANYAIVVEGANRDVRCWGSEGANQCGDGTASTARRTPIAPKW